MTNASSRPTEPDDVIDLAALFSVLWAKKLWIAASVVVALALGAFYVLRTEPVFQAQGLLQLETKSGSLALPAAMQELVGSTGDSPGQTEMEIMKSRMVIGAAVQELGLDRYAYPRPLPVLGQLPRRLGLSGLGNGFLRQFQWGNESLTIGELEVPEDWLGEDMVLTITGPDSFAVTLPDGSELTGRLRERLSLPGQGFSLMVDDLTGPAGREFIFGRMSVQAAVSAIGKTFSVSETPPKSSILRVTYNDPDPRRAEQVLDAISRAYVEQNILRSAAEAQNSLSFINNQLPEAEKAVATAQTALNAYRQQQKSVDLDYETRSLLERATQIETELNALRLKEDELKKRYTINHPVYEALLENRAGLQAQLDELRQTSSALPETQKEVFNLSRNLEVAQQVYLQLLNRAEELKVVRASTVGSVRIVDTAYSNGIKIAPRTSLILVLSMVLGVMLGIGAVLVQHFLRRGIRGAQEIEQAGLPVFATVTFSPEAANHRTRKGNLPIMALERPDDVVVEALRSLRTSLHFGMIDAKTNTVLLTSAAPGAGKSFTAINLATVAAQAGQKVCVIDADMRRGYLRRYFGKPKGTPGLAELLAREKSLDEVLIPGPIEGLSAILTGRFPPNPSELLMRAEFAALLAELDTRFDLIIIDSPPALAVTDPVVIGRSVGATILVARHLETVLPEVEAVRRAFETAGARVTGAVLNGYRIEEGSRYGGQYHYYNYRYSYRSDKS